MTRKYDARVTLVGGPMDGEKIGVDAFTVSVTHQETRATYRRRQPEVWLFDYQEPESIAAQFQAPDAAERAAIREQLRGNVRPYE